MRKNVPLLGSLAVIALTSVVSFSFIGKKSVSNIDHMVAEWERARTYTHDYLIVSTEEAIVYKPTAEMRTFGQQFLHLAEANYFLSAAASGKECPVKFGELEKNSDAYNTKEKLTKAVLDSYDFAITALKETDPSKLNEMVKVFGFDLSRETVFQKAFEHQTHHRGQTTVYLRLKGIKPPDERLF
jgi:uncharacterized damage-inducible protein DinB